MQTVPQLNQDNRQVYMKLFFKKFGLDKLADFTNVLLKSPCSAVPIESAFSKVSDILTRKRTELSDHNLSNLMLLKSNEEIRTYFKNFDD